MGASGSRLDDAAYRRSFTEYDETYATSIKLTPDVLKRWTFLASNNAATSKRAMLHTLSMGSAQESKKPSSPELPFVSPFKEDPSPSKSFLKGLDKENQTHFPINGAGDSGDDHGRSEHNFSSKKFDEDETSKRKSPADVFKSEAEKLNDFEFKRMLNSSKETLRQRTNELSQEKVILGVSTDGKPTFETVGAWKMRQQKEEELRLNDKFWNEKLEAMKNKYINSAFEDAEDFIQRSEKIKEMIPPPRLNVCSILQSKVAKCYASNENELLNCNSIVKEFSACVEKIHIIG